MGADEPRTLNYFRLWRRCLNGRGRFTRSEFAVVYLGSFIGLFAVSFALVAVGAGLRWSQGTIDAIGGVLGLGFIPIMLVAAIGGGVRRWHDLGKSGYYILFAFLPCINLLVILFLLLAPSSSVPYEEGDGNILRVIALVVVGIFGLGIVAAILIPSLLRARISANESATLGDIRKVVAAQAAYASVNQGFYDRDLKCLVRPSIGCIPGYPASSETFLDEGAASLQARSGYRREFKAVPLMVASQRASESSAVRYVFLATPIVRAQTGLRSFCGDDSGVVCARSDGSAIEARNGRCPVGPGPGECSIVD